MFENDQTALTYPWAAEWAGGEARGSSANRPRPVTQTHKNTYGAEVICWINMYFLHVSVNTGGGGSLEVRHG